MSCFKCIFFLTELKRCESDRLYLLVFGLCFCDPLFGLQALDEAVLDLTGGSGGAGIPTSFSWSGID